MIEGVVGFESADFQQGSGDVVGEIAKSQCGAAQVFQSAVDGFGRPVGRAGPVEAGQHILGAFLQRSSQRDDFGQAAGTASLIDSMSALISLRPMLRSGLR